MKVYKVQVQRDDLGWRTIPFAEGTRAYCDGWVDCMDSMYPSKPCRIICIDGKHPQPWHVVRETKGRGAVHTNSEQEHSDG